jgi:hypothetical protein
VTIEQIKTANAGHHFFDRDTMRFFRSRVSSRTYVGRDGRIYFVTSEQRRGAARRYTVRVTIDGTNINSVPEFQAFADARTAHAFAANQ